MKLRRSGEFSDSPTLRWVVEASVQNPRAVLVIWLCVAAAATLGVLRVQFETTGESLLDKTDPAWSYYQDSVARFGGDKVIVLADEGAMPLDPEVMRRIERWTDEAEKLPGVRRVDSVFSFPIVHGETDGSLRIEPAAHGSVDSQARSSTRELLSGDRIAYRTLVSPDGRLLAVNVFLDPIDADAEARVVRSLEVVMGGRGWLSGVPIYETHIGPRTRSEILAFVPLTVILVAVTLFVFFRSWVAVLVPLTTSAVGTWVVIGLMGALKEPITITGMLLPSVLLALGCAYVMHMLVAARGARTSADLIARIHRVSAPVALSGLTTSIGFLAIATIHIDAIQSLAAYGSLGVLVVLAAALTAAPASLRLWPVRGVGGLTRVLETRGAAWLTRFASQRQVGILLAWTVVTAITGVGLYSVAVETDAVLWWPKGTPIRDSYEEIRERLSGISPVNIVIESQEGGSVVAPDVLEAIDGLSEYLSSLPLVGKAVSVADPLRQLHGGFTGDSENPLPAEASLISQYLLLLESVDHIRDVVSEDRKSANVILRVDDNGSKQLLDVAREAEKWWLRHGPSGFSARATGIMFEFGRSEDEIAWGQVRGLVLAFGAVAFFLFLVFRDAKVAALVMVPNLMPLAVIYGLMGWLRIPIDAGTACLGSLALGIAVDDSIHVAANYLTLSRGALARSKALAGTFSQALPAIVMTTVAIAIGFVVLGFSQFTLTRNLGLIVASLVAICLLADATLLPALLLRWVGSGRKEFREGRVLGA